MDIFNSALDKHHLFDNCFISQAAKSAALDIFFSILHTFAAFHILLVFIMQFHFQFIVIAHFTAS
jgi:hypothetical protein